jgi:hypothetical protein
VVFPKISAPARRQEGSVPHPVRFRLQHPIADRAFTRRIPPGSFQRGRHAAVGNGQDGFGRRRTEPRRRGTSAGSTLMLCSNARDTNRSSPSRFVRISKTPRSFQVNEFGSISFGSQLGVVSRDAGPDMAALRFCPPTIPAGPESSSPSAQSANTAAGKVIEPAVRQPLPGIRVMNLVIVHPLICGGWPGCQMPNGLMRT